MIHCITTTIVLVIVLVLYITMVVTRAEAQAIFDHILDNILSRRGSNDLKRALEHEGNNDLFSMMTMDDESIDDLKYPDSADPSILVDVIRGDKGMLKLWREYVLHRESIGDPIGDNWLQVTQQQFDEFRISSKNISRVAGNNGNSPTTQGGSGASTSSKFSKVDLFRKGIKRDPSLFPTLKEEKFNDSWHRSFMTQARAQDVDKVSR